MSHARMGKFSCTTKSKKNLLTLLVMMVRLNPLVGDKLTKNAEASAAEWFKIQKHGLTVNRWNIDDPHTQCSETFNEDYACKLKMSNKTQKHKNSQNKGQACPAPVSFINIFFILIFRHQK